MTVPYSMTGVLEAVQTNFSRLAASGPLRVVSQPSDSLSSGGRLVAPESPLPDDRPGLTPV